MTKFLNKMSKSLDKYKPYKVNHAFTIVELLVVIVVIGILAAIAMVSYSGVTQKAKSAVLQSDLKTASTILEMDKAVNGKYPDTAAEANSGKGLPKSEGTNYDYIPLDGGQGYQLIATSPDITIPPLIISPAYGGSVIKSVRWQQVSSADNNTCAITTEGKAYCWGWNMFGQIGDGTTNNSASPVVVDASALGVKTFKYISSSSYGPCALSTDNKLYCWGLNMTNGQNITTPLDISNYGALSGKTIASISGGIDQGCAIDTNGLAYCWGSNYSGEVGNGSGTTSYYLNPVPISMSGALSGKTIAKIAVEDSHTCVIASDDNTYCWGRNDHGQLGNGLTADSNVPVAVNNSGLLSGKTIKTISVGNGYSCAVASDDNLYCWGWGYGNMLGDGSSVDSSMPVASIASGDLTGKKVKYISLGSPYSRCLLSTDSLAYCRGDNLSGELGNNTDISNDISYSAVYADGELKGKTVKSITSGSSHSCAIASNDQLYCWGFYSNGIESHDDMRITPKLIVP
jgi:prepilin-type N-terminal cleavage/methylation domain-containing protein